MVEAAHRSGSVSTASYAAEMNRPVLAVPGPITSETSRGAHRLIQEGIATVAADVGDLRDAVDGIFVCPGPGDAPDYISASMREVLDVLPSSRTSSVGLALAEVAVRSGVRATAALGHLQSAQALGIVEQRTGGGWVFCAIAERHGRA